MSDDSQRPIVVKKINKGHGGHHGGAWKIAYADFVTAMMAFFLLMWLLGSVSKGKLSGISDYFNTPLKVALQGGDSTGNASSIIPGGGQDLQKISGEVARGQNTANDSEKKIKQAAEKLNFEKIRESIEEAIQKNPDMAQFKNQLLIDMTPEGLRIQLVDEQSRPMFGTGSAKLQDYSVQLLHDLGKLLNEVPNKVSLSGHTDSLAYTSGDKGYSNWELSADRANASRREMIAGGLQEGKILRVVGLGPAVPLDEQNPDAPINRRISIIVLNEDTAASIIKNSGKSDPAGDALVEQAASQ
ncbi:flagellar motor protein MotB [Leeia sp. TBRC 13508]|uniref:Flagellar motor protein MotB n=1 Tax=Leeia speluncae TaxID=2884804 RepID=A0ABS8D5X6_9NEIS|nr:flagellar motor protein MotB [Leeia speluncae]MCB6183608.1 flagellar motor protein MotB [Leeia speluncae]